MDKATKYNQDVCCAIEDVRAFIWYEKMGGEIDCEHPYYRLWSELRLLMLEIDTPHVITKQTKKGES